MDYTLILGLLKPNLEAVRWSYWPNFLFLFLTTYHLASTCLCCHSLTVLDFHFIPFHPHLLRQSTGRGSVLWGWGHEDTSKTVKRNWGKTRMQTKFCGSRHSWCFEANFHWWCVAKCFSCPYSCILSLVLLALRYWCASCRQNIVKTWLWLCRVTACSSGLSLSKAFIPCTGPWTPAPRADTIPLSCYFDCFLIFCFFPFVSLHVPSLPACFPYPPRPHTVHLTPCQSPRTPCHTRSPLNLDYLVFDIGHSLSGLGPFLHPVLTPGPPLNLDPQPSTRCLCDFVGWCLVP